MSNQSNIDEDLEVIVYVDEDGNEIILDDNNNAIPLVEAPAMKPVSVEEFEVYDSDADNNEEILLPKSEESAIEEEFVSEVVLEEYSDDYIEPEYVEEEVTIEESSSEPEKVMDSETIVISPVSVDKEIEEEPVEEKNTRSKASLFFEEDDDDLRYDDSDSVGFDFSSAANKILAIIGVLLAVVAIGAGIIIFGKNSDKTVEVDFSNVGLGIEKIGVIGGDNINAITSKESERLNEIEDAVNNYDYEEADPTTGVTPVSLTMTTILKDLKIKFVNSKGKLIGNVPFEVEVTGPDGKSTTWTDTDKDGIIYKTDIAGGSYNVKLVPLSGFDSIYDFTNTKTQSIAVKTQLDYQKVDVSNEIKDSSKVDKKEDAASEASANDTVEESKNTDTVEYVISSKIENPNGGYTAIDKTSITDPKDTLLKLSEASISRFSRLNGTLEPDMSDAHAHTFSNYVPNGDGTHTASCDVPGCGVSNREKCVDKGNGYCVCGYKLSASDIEVSGTMTISGTKEYKMTSDGKKGELSASVSISPDNYKVSSYSWSITSGDDVISISGTDSSKISIEALKAGEAKVKCVAILNDPNSTKVSKTAKITVEDVLKITLSPKDKYQVIYLDGDSFEIKATTKGGKTNKVTWSISDDSIAAISSSEVADSEKGTSTCIVKGLKEGKVKLKAVSTEDDTVSKTVTILFATNPKEDKVTKLVDDKGNQVYVFDTEKKEYVEATYANYYTGETLYISEGQAYIYTGWWTIDGKTYYYNSKGEKVTGDQVILGAKYSFDADGVLKSGTGSFGIDVSVWNGNIDWNKVAKSGVSYAIIRCGFRGTTLGGLVQDTKFDENMKGAMDAGLKVGVYFFTQAISEAEAVEEASMCIELCKKYKLTYPIFMDVETTSGGRANALSVSERTAVIKAFCKTITNAGYKAGVYSNKTWLSGYMNVSELTNYTIWLAQYSATPNYTSSRYDLWQYSSTGSINGISGEVDLDISYLGY